MVSQLLRFYLDRFLQMKLRFFRSSLYFLFLVIGRFCLFSTMNHHVLYQRFWQVSSQLHDSLLSGGHFDILCECRTKGCEFCLSCLVLGGVPVQYVPPVLDGAVPVVRRGSRVSVGVTTRRVLRAPRWFRAARRLRPPRGIRVEW